MLSPPVVVEQTNQGLPWRAKVDTDAMLRETAMLLTRTSDAVVNPSLRVVEKKVRKATQKERSGKLIVKHIASSPGREWAAS